MPVRHSMKSTRSYRSLPSSRALNYVASCHTNSPHRQTAHIWSAMTLERPTFRPTVVEHFKYLGSLKSADGNCNKDTRSRIGMAKKRMLDLVPIWKDRGITKDLKMKLVRSLVWTVLTYGAEGWTLTKADEKRSNQQNCGFIVGCYESVGLNIEQTKASARNVAPPESF